MKRHTNKSCTPFDKGWVLIEKKGIKNYKNWINKYQLRIVIKSAERW